jgi:error-prone DNA polymerase
VQAAVKRQDAVPLVERQHWAPLAADPMPLPPMGALETMAADYRAMGLSTGVHPMQLVRAKLRERGVLEAAQVVALGRKLGAGNGNMDVRKGPRVRVAGLAISRQGPPTAKGFIFITLEDETGFANIIVRPDVVEKYRAVVVREAILYVEGGMSIEGGTINIVARHLEPLALDDPRVRFRSRDFR